MADCRSFPLPRLKSCLFAALALAAACAFSAGCEQRVDASVPAHLIGVWKTDHPRYRDLFFEVTSTHVIFNTVEGGVESYRIARAESSPQGAASAHVLYGERPDESVNFHLYYENTAGGRLRFKNQIFMAWSKTRDGR
jgi:hypothetical protein